MKDYNKALEAYDCGLKIEENNQELLDAVNRTLEAINNQSRGQDDNSRIENAMKDPEVQEILSDPVMRQILQDMQSDPGAAQE
jgi:stress-induced-phosphoprotein 1